MAKLAQSEEIKEIELLLEKLHKIDFSCLTKCEQKEIGKNLKKLQSFLNGNVDKAIKGRKKDSKWYLDDNLAEFNRMLENTAAFLIDYYMIDRPSDKLALKYATIGSELDNPHCLFALSYMYAKGKCGVIANSKKARVFIERAINAGGTDDVNFEIAKNAMLECEKRAASMYSAALADRITDGGFLEILCGFSDWLNNYTTVQDEKRALEKQSKGTVKLEKTATGDSYYFYSDESPNVNGKRLRNYDPLSGKGVLDSGEEVERSND